MVVRENLGSHCSGDCVEMFMIKKTTRTCLGTKATKKAKDGHDEAIKKHARDLFQTFNTLARAHCHSN